MKAQDFLDWCDAMGIKTAGDAAEALGASRNTTQPWFVAAKDGLDVPVKKTTALAMSALYHRLDEWREK